MNDPVRTLQDQVILLHRQPGYVRFLLPEALCGKSAEVWLCQALEGREGIRRARVNRASGKLSICHLDAVCNFQDVARRLGAAVAAIARGETAPRPAAATDSSTLQKLKSKAGRSPFLARWRGRIEGARSTLGMVARAARREVKLHENEAPPWERAAIMFFNDIAIFYLIKVHWKLITEKWLKFPIRHRYEWLTVFYLLFLTIWYKKRNKEAKG